MKRNDCNTLKFLSGLIMKAINAYKAGQWMIADSLVEYYDKIMSGTTTFGQIDSEYFFDIGKVLNNVYNDKIWLSNSDEDFDKYIEVYDANKRKRKDFSAFKNDIL